MPKNETVKSPGSLTGVAQSLGRATLSAINTLTLYAATEAAERQQGAHQSLSGFNPDADSAPTTNSSTAPDINT